MAEEDGVVVLLELVQGEEFVGDPLKFLGSGFGGQPGGIGGGRWRDRGDREGDKAEGAAPCSGYRRQHLSLSRALSLSKKL